MPRNGPGAVRRRVQRSSGNCDSSSGRPSGSRNLYAITDPLLGGSSTGPPTRDGREWDAREAFERGGGVGYRNREVLEPGIVCGLRLRIGSPEAVRANKAERLLAQAQGSDLCSIVPRGAGEIEPERLLVESTGPAQVGGDQRDAGNARVVNHVGWLLDLICVGLTAPIEGKKPASVT